MEWHTIKGAREQLFKKKEKNIFAVHEPIVHFVRKLFQDFKQCWCKLPLAAKQVDQIFHGVWPMVGFRFLEERKEKEKKK